MGSEMCIRDRGGSLSLREAVPVRRGGSLSLREAVSALGRRTYYLRHFREAVVSVCERQCRPLVPGPIIYGTSTRGRPGSPTAR